jgi:SSS family solute:Na+ symporter
MTLTPVDWIIIALYLAGCMFAGLWMRRYVRGVQDFAVAGREMDVNLGIASLAATELGLVTIMYTAQLGYEKGFAGAITKPVRPTSQIAAAITTPIIAPAKPFS